MHARNFKYHIDMGSTQELMMLIEVSLVINGRHGWLDNRVAWAKKGSLKSLSRLIETRLAKSLQNHRCHSRRQFEVGLITALLGVITVPALMLMMIIININNAPAMKREYWARVHRMVLTIDRLTGCHKEMGYVDMRET